MILTTKLKEERDYWVSKLSREIGASNLALDYPRSKVYSATKDAVELRLPAEVSLKMMKMAGGSSFLLYTILMSALKICLYRYTGNETIVVGSPAHKSEGEERTNALAIVDDVDEKLSFREFLMKVRDTLSEAYARQSYALNDLVRDLGIENADHKCPLFDIVIALKEIHCHLPEIKNDITMTFTEGAGDFSGLVEFNPRLFQRASIERFTRHFANVLSGASGDVNQPVSELDCLTDDERDQLLAKWNNTQDFPQYACVHQLFEAQVERTPDAIALVFEDEELSYQELNRRANQLAHYLRGLGVGAETLVGLCLERSVEMVVGVLGVLKAGGTYVPLDPSYPRQRLSLMMEDAAFSVVLTQQHLVHALAGPAAKVVCLDTEREAIARESQQNPASGVTAANLAYVIYTSGSTGNPKGVQITHRSVVNFLDSMRGEPGLSADDVLLSVTSLSFDIAGLELFLPLIVGARIALVSRAVASDGIRLREQLQKSQANVMQATPATYRLLLNSGCKDFSGMKILCGGEAFPRQLANQLLEQGARLWNMYGPTESTIWSAAARVAAEEGVVLIGRPIANTQIYLFNERLQVVPVGVAGELYIGGAGLTRGYLHRPELTAEKMIPDPYSTERGTRLYKTGDLARYRSDGQIEFLGRLDHQVKVRGHRIELGEIEAVLNRHEAVRESVVMTREDAPGNNSLIAYIVPAADQAVPTVSELRNFLREALPDYMIPSNLVVLEALPLTPNGKLDRRALPGPDSTRPAVETLFVAPTSEVERDIASVWREVLKLEKVGIHDNFFELGGHSLMLVQVHTKLREKLNRELSVVEMFRYPTINSLAKNLRRMKPESAPPGEPLSDKLVAGKKRLQQIFNQEQRRAAKPGRSNGL